MAETERIEVARTKDGPGGTGEPDRAVSVPVVELLTGRGFVTGKSGSGKSNTASVIAENLLENGFGLCIVDIDGEYYGLKEEYEILHVGGDEECDMQVTTDHAEKLAALALEENVPLILDVSSFLDEDEAADLLTAVAKHLFAKAKKQKQPFLLLVEEVHEYIPEGGSVGECGRMLIKIGKRGRKHGLGICGISQRPADVKKDYITQCDWLVWHRLTWDNDTNVVRRVLDGEYARAVEDLDDGEAFLVADWADAVRRVQFHRKETFDAGATPGLDDFERPELKSVSSDLVSELEAISEAERERESRVRELREELDEKNSRIAELEAQLQDARDLSRMADRFVEGLFDRVNGRNPAVTERERLGPDDVMGGDGRGTTGGDSDPIHDSSEADSSMHPSEEDGMAAFAAVMDGEPTSNGQRDPGPSNEATPAGESTGLPDADDSSNESTSGGSSEPTGTAGRPDASEADAAGAPAADGFRWIDSTDGESDRGSTADDRDAVHRGAGHASESTDEDVSLAVGAESEEETAAAAGRTHDRSGVPAAVTALRAALDDLDPAARAMLGRYCRRGPSEPLEIHPGDGGKEDRTDAYAYNRQLRTAGLIEHVGRGLYEDRLAAWLRDADEEGLPESRLRAYVAELTRLRLE